MAKGVVGGKSHRDMFLERVVPRIRETHPSGIINYSDLVAALTFADLSFQPYLRASMAGRGLFDLTALYAEAAERTANDEIKPVEDTRSDNQVAAEIRERFDALERMAQGVIDGQFRSIIVSGPPGIGKTFGLNRQFETARDAGKITYKYQNGYGLATGLYRMLWDCKDANAVLMLDDFDAVFGSEIALNLLKAACDSSRKRMLSWKTEKRFETSTNDATGLDEIPEEFEFKGHIIFVTNLNFDRMIASSSRLGPHLEAMLSRAFYIDMNLDSQRELIVRIKDVVYTTDMLGDMSNAFRDTIVSWVEHRKDDLREISLRTITKAAEIFRTAKSLPEFERMAKASLLRRKGS